VKKFKCSVHEMSLYVISIFLFGILVAKLVGVWGLAENRAIQIMAIVQVMILFVLAWISGWMHKRNDD